MHAAPEVPRRALAAIQKVPRRAQAARALDRRAQAALPKVQRRASPAVRGYDWDAHAAQVPNRRRSEVRAPRLQPAGRLGSRTPATTVRARPARPSVSGHASSSRYPRRVSPTPRSWRWSVSQSPNSSWALLPVARFCARRRGQAPEAPRRAHAALKVNDHAETHLHHLRASTVVLEYDAKARAAPTGRDASSNRRRSPRFRSVRRLGSKAPSTTVHAEQARPPGWRRVSSSRHPRHVSPTPRSWRWSVSQSPNSSWALLPVACFGARRRVQALQAARQVLRLPGRRSPNRNRSWYDASPRACLGAASRQRGRETHRNAEGVPLEPERARWPCAASSRRRTGPRLLPWLAKQTP